MRAVTQLQPSRLPQVYILAELAIIVVVLVCANQMPESVDFDHEVSLQTIRANGFVLEVIAHVLASRVVLSIALKAEVQLCSMQHRRAVYVGIDILYKLEMLYLQVDRQAKFVQALVDLIRFRQCQYIDIGIFSQNVFTRQFTALHRGLEN